MGPCSAVCGLAGREKCGLTTSLEHQRARWVNDPDPAVLDAIFELMPASGVGSDDAPGEADSSALTWLKITDPDERLPSVVPGTDLRVLLPDQDRFEILAEKLRALGAKVRRVRYLVEDEAITVTPVRGAPSWRPGAG
jgi:hypothetical protein